MLSNKELLIIKGKCCYNCHFGEDILHVVDEESKRSRTCWRKNSTIVPNDFVCDEWYESEYRNKQIKARRYE